MERKMNLFTKAGPLVVALSMTTASAFGQSNNSCPPKPKCEEMKQVQLMAGYNAPSRIEVRGCWDVYASASFTYFQPCQDGTEVGYTTETVESVDYENVINQKFSYKPGFKVALGMNFDHDNWDSMIQYSWFRGSDTSSTKVDAAVQTVRPIGSSIADAAYTEASQTWKLHMDLIDWDLGRNYYVGTKLTFRPFFGARAAWIRQNLVGTFSNADVASTKALYQSSSSWGVGARTGLNTNWALGEGFRLFGNGAADVLFTQYTKLKTHTEDAKVVKNVASQGSLNCLRSHLDLEVGLGWGSYFDCNNWHVDLTAGYGFQVFFDQNMFRPTPSNVDTAFPGGNLYVHGLTASARFDF